MSKLYDALKKLESKKPLNSNVPDFKPQKKNKSQSVLIFASLFFFIFAVSAGIFFLNKVRQETKTIKIKQSYPLSVSKHHISQNKTVKIKQVKQAKTVSHSARAKNTIIKNTETKSIKPKSKKSIELQRHQQTIVLKKRATIKQEKSTQKKGSNETISSKKNITKQAELSIEELLNLAKNGSDTQAIKAYKKLIGIFPDNADLYNNLAVRYMNRGDYVNALKALKKALQISDDPDIKLNYVLALVKLKKMNKARQEILTIDPNSVSNKKLYTTLFKLVLSK